MSASSSSDRLRWKFIVRERIFIRKKHTVVEGKLRVQLVTQAMWLSSRATTIASEASSGRTSSRPRLTHDGVADREGLERRSQKARASNFGLNIKIISDDEVVDDCGENLVDIAGRRQQTNLLEALHGVVFRLVLPHALGFYRGRILSGLTLIADGLRIDLDRM